MPLVFTALWVIGLSITWLILATYMWWREEKKPPRQIRLEELLIDLQAIRALEQRVMEDLWAAYPIEIIDTEKEEPVERVNWKEEGF